METTAANHDLGWLLDTFVNQTTGAVSALVTSRDGMQIASHTLLDKPVDGASDKLSAVASGMHSLALGAVPLLGDSGGVRQIIVELDKGHLFVMAAGTGSLLSVLVGAESDIEQVSYEMSLLVKRVPGYLSVAPRTESAAAGEPVQ